MGTITNFTPKSQPCESKFRWVKWTAGMLPNLCWAGLAADTQRFENRLLRPEGKRYHSDMVTAQELLSRIRFDPEFAKGEFELGYYDRVADEILYVGFERIRFQDGNQFSFLVEGKWGEEISIPFHRLRQVQKNGELIWERPRPREESS